MDCPQCGNTQEEGIPFCSNCGAALSPPSGGEKGASSETEAHPSAPAPATGSGGSRTPLLIGIIAVLIVAAVVLVLVFTVFKGDGDGGNGESMLRKIYDGRAKGDNGHGLHYTQTSSSWVGERGLPGKYLPIEIFWCSIVGRRDWLYGYNSPMSPVSCSNCGNSSFERPHEQEPRSAGTDVGRDNISRGSGCFGFELFACCNFGCRRNHDDVVGLAHRQPFGLQDDIQRLLPVNIFQTQRYIPADSITDHHVQAGEIGQQLKNRTHFDILEIKRQSSRR